MNPRIVLPAFLSGLIWSWAQIGGFIANQKLSYVVSFPITNTCPGLLAATLGVLLFKEVTGKRNMLFLCAAIFAAIVGVTMITVSKVA